MVNPDYISDAWLVRCWVLCALLVLGCSRPRQSPAEASRPIAVDEATTLVAKLEGVAVPCNADQFRPFIDSDAFRDRVSKHDPEQKEAVVAKVEGFTGMSLVATKWCAWLHNIDDYKFLRLRQVAGHSRAVMRRSTGLTATYHELELVRSRDGKVRVADVYSYFKGEWISEEIAALQKAGAKNPAALTTGLKLAKVTALENAEPAEALAVLDSLPAEMLALRSIQGWRVKLGQNVSMEVYKTALDELARRFPDDPSVALLAIDGAILGGDLTGALRSLDLVDAQLGPDPYLTSTRAMILVLRNGSGDLDAAERVMRAEPELAITSLARIAVAVGRHQWTSALEQMDQASQRFQLQFDDTMLSAPLYTELVKTPEFAAWRAKRP